MAGTAPANETPWRKAIPPQRDRLQSRVLVCIMLPYLTVFSLLSWLSATSFDHGSSAEERKLAYVAMLVSWTFGILVWALRSATPWAAFCGSLICWLVTSFTLGFNKPIVWSALSPLFALFLLTYLATRAGRRRKARLGLAESKKGRNAAQVIANLGATTLCVAGMAYGSFDPLLPGGGLISPSHWAGKVLILAALAEATADTVSSEIGQAFGGTPFLVTTFKRVAPGTDGAISLRGTATGIAGAALVSGLGLWAMALSPEQTLIAFLAGVAGLFFDSLLGATVERKGWLGNDLVNFTSTLFAAAAALLALALL